MKLFLHKLKHWEYWTVYIVYMPVFFYWLWLMLKFKSFTFYKLANPGIHNGGFQGESKMDIYRLLPSSTFPKTVLIELQNKYDFNKIIAINELKFPLILKPDVGERGVDVIKVNSVLEIEKYYKTINKNFLMQEFIHFANEIGLFYYRIPGNQTGNISGITLKKFLTVEGNGIESIEQLLRKIPRYEMQIKKLKSTIDLSEIIQKNEVRCLVPYGNHNRGTAFFDGENFITEKLESSFNTILNAVPGFYYGRLDIRFNSFEELEKGENFSIIELNGVKSEPTHMYDPKHSFWFGQKEIFKHQKVMLAIIKKLI